MILDELEVRERLESPLNLLNRLRSTTTNKHRINIIPSLPPTSSEIIDNLEDKIGLGSIKSKAAGIMVSALDELKNRLPEVTKPKELASIAEQMNKVISVQESKNGDNSLKIGQVIIYAPKILTEDSYDVIDVSRSE